MRKTFIAVICVGMFALFGCRSTARFVGNAAEFAAIGLWNGIFDDDISYRYDSSDKRWRVVDDDERDAEIPWSESMEYNGGP